MENRNNTVSYFKSLKTRLDDANERYKRVTNNLGDNWWIDSYFNVLRLLYRRVRTAGWGWLSLGLAFADYI